MDVNILLLVYTIGITRNGCKHPIARLISIISRELKEYIIYLIKNIMYL